VEAHLGELASDHARLKREVCACVRARAFGRRAALARSVLDPSAVPVHTGHCLSDRRSPSGMRAHSKTLLRVVPCPDPLPCQWLFGTLEPLRLLSADSQGNVRVRTAEHLLDGARSLPRSMAQLSSGLIGAPPGALCGRCGRGLPMCRV
jgi:hypothetical protein